MFGFFKKKKQQTKSVIEPSTRDTLIRTAQMVEMQLFICKSVDRYDEMLNSPYVKGYLLGFFDAALQYSNVVVDNDEKFFSLMAFGHMALLGEKHAFDYVASSVMLQKDSQFQHGQAEGGSEYFDYLNEKIKGPYKLTNHFHSLS